MLTRHVRLPRRVAIAANPERQTRRRRRFQAFFSTAIWRAFRERVFARDGYRCVRVVDGVRCPQSRATGARLVCNHVTYARFGGMELLEDCETLCGDCDAVCTTSDRVNWSEARRHSRRRSFAVPSSAPSSH